MDTHQPRKRGRRPRTPARQPPPTVGDQRISRLAMLIGDFELDPSKHRRDVNRKTATILQALLDAAVAEDARQIDELLATARKLLGQRPPTHQLVKDVLLAEVRVLLERLDAGYSPWDRREAGVPQSWLEQKFRIIVGLQCPNELVPGAGLASTHVVRGVIDTHWREDLREMRQDERRRWSQRLVNALLRKLGVERPDAT